MKKNNIFIFIIMLLIFITGCTKKNAELTQSEESVDSQVEPIFMSEIAENSDQEDEAIYLPPAGPYRPRAQQIQTALKNAGYYHGNIDGKIGPLTNEAIKDFQKANNLKVDAKVGPKTWEILRRYLKSPAQ